MAEPAKVMNSWPEGQSAFLWFGFRSPLHIETREWADDLEPALLIEALKVLWVGPVATGLNPDGNEALLGELILESFQESTTNSASTH